MPWFSLNRQGSAQHGVQDELLSSILVDASCGRLCQVAADAEHAKGDFARQHVFVWA